GPQTVVTVTLSEQRGKTTMTFRQAFFESAASRDGHGEGWSSSFDCLDEHLAALRSEGVAKEIRK
ncbi:MAG: Activator of Hsp90 ATPase-like protein, partial [Gammaproteobacteria bacterium]|nr:Activator of Hsp90 ATPase-like protein [Gammaproteobacteria bacterium]